MHIFAAIQLAAEIDHWCEAVVEIRADGGKPMFSWRPELSSADCLDFESPFESTIVEAASRVYKEEELEERLFGEIESKAG